jgi:hypothetical protein
LKVGNTINGHYPEMDCCFNKDLRQTPGVKLSDGGKGNLDHNASIMHRQAHSLMVEE